MKILYEDKELCVCIKPYDMLSQADNTCGESAVSVLQESLDCEIFPVHRLDRVTGGLMVFAKTKKAAAELSAQIADKRFKKQYVALVHGGLENESGELKDLLFFDRQKNKSYVVKRKRSGVKEASLFCERVGYDKNSDVSLYKITLKTGRTHQIRVQLGSRGCPILGDRRYGSADTFEHIFLWSYALEFLHPEDKRTLCFMCAPEDWCQECVFFEKMPECFEKLERKP